MGLISRVSSRTYSIISFQKMSAIMNKFGKKAVEPDDWSSSDDDTPINQNKRIQKDDTDINLSKQINKTLKPKPAPKTINTKIFKSDDQTTKITIESKLHSSQQVTRGVDKMANFSQNEIKSNLTKHESQNSVKAPKVDNFKDKLSKFNNVQETKSFQPKQIVIERGPAKIVENVPIESMKNEVNYLSEANKINNETKNEQNKTITEQDTPKIPASIETEQESNSVDEIKEEMAKVEIENEIDEQKVDQSSGDNLHQPVDESDVRAKALFDYLAEDEDELSFDP